MPYKIFKNDAGEFCVHKESADGGKGEKIGCSPTRDKALAQMRALYAAESKELLIEELMEQKEIDNTESVEQHEKGYVPYGISSFSDLDKYREERERAEQLFDKLDDYAGLVMSIASNPEIPNKASAFQALASEFASRTGEFKEKEADETKAVWTTAYKNDLPDSAFLYVESGEKDSEGKTTPRSKRHFPVKDKNGNYDIAHVRNAIARIPQSNAPGLSAAKKASLQKRAQRILANMQKENLTNWIKEKFDALKEVLNLITPDDRKEIGSMMIYKDSGGNYRWFTRYSNNIRDNDNPPEIISAKSHKRYVELVDNGNVPYPELWLWHIKEWKIGVADFVAFDDSGFALAAGYFLPGREHVAKWLKSRPDFLTSHGMPIASVKRDQSDPTIIIEHETSEISPLPATAAANRRGTNFIVLGKEVDMSIPAHKRQALIDLGLEENVIDELEALNAAEAAKAAQEGVDSKEVSDEAETGDVADVTEEIEEEHETEPENKEEEDVADVDETEAVADEAVYATTSEVAEAVATVINPILEQLGSINERLNAINEEVKELKQSDEQKIAEKAEQVPMASIQEMIMQRVIGNADARVSGNTGLGRAKPKEAAPVDDSKGITGLKLIDDMIYGKPIDFSTLESAAEES